GKPSGDRPASSQPGFAERRHCGSSLLRCAESAAVAADRVARGNRRYAVCCRAEPATVAAKGSACEHHGPTFTGRDKPATAAAEGSARESEPVLARGTVRLRKGAAGKPTLSARSLAADPR